MLQPFWNSKFQKITNRFPIPKNYKSFTLHKQLKNSIAKNNIISGLNIKINNPDFYKKSKEKKVINKKIAICQEINCDNECHDSFKVCIDHYNSYKNNNTCYVINLSGKKINKRCNNNVKNNGLCYRHIPKTYEKTSKNNKGLASRMIRIYPNNEQKQILKQWFGVARKVYNKTLVIYRDRTKLSKDVANVRFRLERTLYNKKYVKNVPLQIRDNAIKDYLKADNNARLKYKKDKKISKLTFRSRKDTSQSIEPKKECVKRILNNNNRYRLLQVYSTYLSPIKTKEDIPEFTSCRIVMKYNREFYIKADMEYIKPEKINNICSDKCIGVDPNIKNMFGYYSTTKCGIIGENINDIFNKYNRKISRLQSIRDTISNSDHKKLLLRKIQRQYTKRENKRDEIHWELINSMLSNYDIIFIPIFNEHEKCKKLRSRINKNMFSISHSLFRKRLTYKADKQGKYAISMTEEYTTKTCSNCGKLNIPTDRSYYCYSCGVIYHRDINSSKNIFMKGLLELLNNQLI